MAEAPYNVIHDYMIRSAFSSAIARTLGSRIRTVNEVTKDADLKKTINDDAKVDIPEWKKDPEVSSRSQNATQAMSIISSIQKFWRHSRTK
jgi:hypothetical protein